MANTQQSPEYDSEPAFRLLDRLNHTIAPNKERVEAAGKALLTAFHSLGEHSAPLRIEWEVVETNVRVTLPAARPDTSGVPRHTTAQVRFNWGDGSFVVHSGETDEMLDAHVAYDAAVGAFVPTKQAHEAARREVTAVEVLLQAAWDAVTGGGDTSWRNLYR